jgi:peptide deformylase
MTILKVLKIPDKRLYRKTQKVTNIDNEIRTISQDMIETMYSENGIGLAANQVGINKSIIVIDLQEESEEERFVEINNKKEKLIMPIVIINPQILKKSKKTISFEEGCLSVPKKRIEINRSNSLILKYSDQWGRKCILSTEGLLSVCIQHEIDHLNAITIVERQLIEKGLYQ